MLHKIPKVNPRIHTHFFQTINEEYFAILSMLRFYWPLALLFVLGIGALVYVARPFPPSHLRLATGQPNSSFEMLGKKYVDYFKQNGVQLELVPTDGGFNNIELLKQRKIDAAFSLGGVPIGSDAANIVSLGSVDYQPLWLFYRGDEYDGSNPSIFFGAKTFSVNIPGSGTHFLTDKILALHGINIVGNSHMVSLSSKDSVDALFSGKIDGLFMLAGLDSQNIQKIFNVPGVRIFNFSMAQAYYKHLKFLEMVSLPLGSINVRKVFPPQNINMVATTTEILADKKLHPAIQHLFLNCAHQIAETRQAFFDRPGGFPAFTDRTVPASAVAERYYTKGPPALNGYLPYWIASYLDQIWFILFAAIAILYPLKAIVPNYRTFYCNLCMMDSYTELSEIDFKLNESSTPDELQLILDNIMALEKRINQLWVPDGLFVDFYSLRNAVEIVRMKALRIQNN